MMDYSSSCITLFYLTLLIAVCQSMKCWQCVSDDCDEDPAINYKATRRTCQPGEGCQKVYYEIKDHGGNTMYLSTVRSCSVGRCEPRNDFINCTSDYRENPGCMQRFCCDDKDMCNSTRAPSGGNLWIVTLLITSLLSLLTTFTSDTTYQVLYSS